MALPFVSFFIVSYNQEKYIADAVKGALSQNYPNMEIIISDDCSTDGTWSIIQETISNYSGDKNIRLNRNNHNLGIREHINKVLYELARGEIIVFAAGDDISLPNRTSVSVSFLEKHPEVSSLSFSSQAVDESLKPFPIETVYTLSCGLDSIITLEDYVLYDYFIFSGDSRVIRRKVIESFPKLRYPAAEDIYIFIRSLYVGSVAYIRQPLVLYRQHKNNVSKLTHISKEVFEQTVQRQILEDLDYAVTHHFLREGQKSCVLRRLDWVNKELFFQCVGRQREQHSLLYRIAKSIKHEMKESWLKWKANS